MHYRNQYWAEVDTPGFQPDISISEGLTVFDPTRLTLNRSQKQLIDNNGWSLTVTNLNKHVLHIKPAIMDEELQNQLCWHHPKLWSLPYPWLPPVPFCVNAQGFSLAP